MVVRKKFTRKKKPLFKRSYAVKKRTYGARRSKYARKTSYRRRTAYKKKKSRFSNYVVDPRSRLFPMVKRATLVYVNEGIVLVPPAAKGCAVSIWNAIGMFDPEFAFGGHQVPHCMRTRTSRPYLTPLPSRSPCTSTPLWSST